MTESFRLRHVNWIVGLFLLIVFAALLGIVLLTLSAQGYLSKNVSYYTDIPQEDLGSLKKGADVLLLGEVVGKVYAIEPIERQRLKITMRIKEVHRENILEDSTVVLRQPLAVGAAHFEILRGPSGGQPIAASLEAPGYLPLGDPGSSFADVGQIVGQGMAQIVDNFDRARSAIVWGMNAFRSLSQTTERGVDPAIAELRQAIEELRATTARTEITLKNTLEDIAETSRTVSDRTKNSASNLDANIEEMQQSLATVERATVERLRTIQHSIDQLNRDVTRAVDIFESVMADLKKVTPDLPDTIDSMNNAISDADDVIDGVKRHPLLRKYVEQEKGTRQTAPAAIRGGGP